MAEIHFSESAAQALKGRVVVLTGESEETPPLIKASTQSEILLTREILQGVHRG